MAIKSSFKNGSLVILNPKTGTLASDDDSDALDAFSDESINSDEFDSEFSVDNGEQSFDENELKPLSEIWDMDDDNDEEEKTQDPDSNVQLNLDTKQEELEELSSSDDEESFEESSGDEADSESDIFDDSEEDDEDDNNELTNVLDNLKKSQKKTTKQKKNLISLELKENELSMPIKNNNKLSLEEMMGLVKDKNLKDEAILLKNQETIKPLAIPLPKRFQERNERSAAYEISKNEVDKWKDDVERIKRAEVIKFPLIGATEDLKKVSVFTKSEKPLNELEEKVNGMLEESLLADTKKEALFEQLSVAKMSKEDMVKRNNELRLMRELLFREEKKAKRIKKIKSKSYRRVKKRELLKNQELMKEIEGEEDMNEADEARAEARMTLKFKNNSNKWAKDMLKHGMTKDKETRSEMEAMLRQGDQLRQKILGHDDDESDKDEELKDISSDDDNNEEEINEQKSSIGKSGFFNMPFMKKAESLAKEKNQEELKKLKRLENGLDIDDFQNENSNAKVILNKGRKIFTPLATKTSNEFQEHIKSVVKEHEIDESNNLNNRLQKKFNKETKESIKEVIEEKETEKEESEESNPWLGSNAKKASKKIKVIDESSNKAEKQEYKLNKLKKNKESTNNNLELINPDSILNINKETLNNSDSDDDDDNDDEFQQKDLIKEAFVGDNVTKEFEKEKKRIRKEEDDKWVEAEAPGFDSWIGGTTKQRKRQKQNLKLKKVKGVKSADQRKDKNLKNVIYNEKVNKKNLKYQSSSVPFPYEDKDQYERSLQMPIGQEWNSRAVFQNLTMPNVITKPGHVIKPLTKKSGR